MSARFGSASEPYDTRRVLTYAALLTGSLLALIGAAFVIVYAAHHPTGTGQAICAALLAAVAVTAARLMKGHHPYDSSPRRRP